MLLLLCSATSVLAAEAPDPGLPAAQVAQLYLDCLERFEPYAESIWHEVEEPPGSGYFGDGASSGNGGIRGTAGISLAYATLLRAGRGSPADRSRRRERLEAALRYAAFTHRTGNARCIDGKQWGGGWQTPLWAGTLGFAAARMEAELEPELVAQCRRVIADEADRLAAIPPPSGYQGDSKAEENAWNSNIPALAAAWPADDPRAPEWAAAAKRYLANTYTVPDTAGDPLAEWVTTQTLYPSFACENHGFFHPSYQGVAGMSLGDSLTMARVLRPRVAEELAPFAEHNALPVWRCLRQMLLDSAELAYPSGLDWSLHGYGQISYYTWLGTHLGDPTGRWAETVLAQRLAYKQRLNGDGRFQGDSLPNGFYHEAVMARRISLSWWRHQVAQHPDGPREAPGLFITHLPDVKLLLQRSGRGFVSLSYGPRVMGLVVPESATCPGDPYVVTPRYPSLLAPGSTGAIVRAIPRRLAVNEAGFDVTLDLETGALEQRTVRFASFGDAVAIIEVPGGALGAAGGMVAAFPVGIENHALTGGERDVAWEGGRERIAAMSGAQVETAGGWLSVSEKYGFIAGPGGVIRYQGAESYNRPGAAEDDLHFEPAAAAAPRYALILPGADAAATRAAAGTVEWEAEGAWARLSFEAPLSGRHVLRLRVPSRSEGRQVVPVETVEASTQSERHPPALAADGDAGTFWCSSRGGQPGDGPTKERPEWLEFALGGQAVAQVLIVPRPGYGPKDIALLLDGDEVFAGALGSGPRLVELPQPRPVQRARLAMISSYDPSHPATPRNVQVCEVTFIGGPKR